MNLTLKIWRQANAAAEGASQPGTGQLPPGAA
jgi:hypothetical protein